MTNLLSHFSLILGSGAGSAPAFLVSLLGSPLVPVGEAANNSMTVISMITNLIWSHVMDFIYYIAHWVWNLVDIMQYLVYKLAGIGSAEDIISFDNPLFDFLLNKNVLRIFEAMLILAVVLVIVFAIIALIKVRYSEATDVNNDNNRKVFGRVSKTLFIFVMGPAVLLGFIILTNSIISSLNRTLNTSGMSTSLGGQMFTAASYDANRYRQYADKNKRIPILINFDDPIKDGRSNVLSNSELVEVYKTFTKGQIIYDDFATENFKTFDDTLVYNESTKSTYNAASTYSDFEKFVCTREQYYVMADFIDDSVQNSTHFHIKNSSSSDIDWKYVNSSVYHDNVLTINYKGSDNKPKIVTYATNSIEPSTPIEDAITVISEILGLGGETNANSFNMLERLEGSLNVVDWTSESAVIYYKDSTTTDGKTSREFSATPADGYTKAVLPVKEVQKRTYWPSLGTTVVTGTYKAIAMDLGTSYYVVEKLEKETDEYSYKLLLSSSNEPSLIEIGQYDVVSDYIKKGTWPEKLLNDMSVIFSDINIKDLISSGKWREALSTIQKNQNPGNLITDPNSSSFGTSMINPLGIILAEMFLGSISYPKPNEAFGKMQFEPVYNQRTLRSIMIAIVGEDKYFNLRDQLGYYTEIFNNMMTPVLDSISNAEGFELSNADTESVRLYTYKSYLASLLLEKNFSDYMGNLAFDIVNLNFIFNKVLSYNGTINGEIIDKEQANVQTVSMFIDTLTNADKKYVFNALNYINSKSSSIQKMPRSVQLFVQFFCGQTGNEFKARDDNGKIISVIFDKDFFDNDISAITEGRWRDIMNSDVITSDIDAINIADKEEIYKKRIKEIIEEFKSKTGSTDNGYTVLYEFLVAIEKGGDGKAYDKNGNIIAMNLASKKWIYDHYINDSKKNKDNYIGKTEDKILAKYRDMLVEYYGLRNQLDMYYKHSVYSNLKSYISESMASQFNVVVGNKSYAVSLNTSSTKFAEMVLGNSLNGKEVINSINSGMNFKSLSYYGQKIITMIKNEKINGDLVKSNINSYIAGTTTKLDDASIKYIEEWFTRNSFNFTYISENYEGIVDHNGEAFGLLRDFLGDFGEYCFDISLKSNFLNLTENFSDVDFTENQTIAMLRVFLKKHYDGSIENDVDFKAKLAEAGFVYNENYRLKDYKKQALNMLVKFPVRMGESQKDYTIRYLFALNLACAEYAPYQVDKENNAIGDVSIVVSDYSKGLILRLAGIPNRPESEIVGLEYAIDLKRDYKSSENDGAVYIMCEYNPETFLYEPLLYSGSASDKFSSEYYYYDTTLENRIDNNSGKKSGNFYPIIAKGIFDSDGNPTTIRENNGKIEFYRDVIYVVNAGEFKLTSYYQTTDMITVRYGIIGSIVNAGSLLFSGKTLTAHLLEKIPRFAVNTSLNLPYGVKNSLVYSVNDGSVALDYNFNAREAISMRNLYSPGDLNIIILMFATAFIFMAIFKLVWAMIKRIFDITILFVMSPVAVSAGVLSQDDSRVSTWMSTMSSRILSVYGIVIALNIFFILIPIINQVNLFTPESFVAVTNITLFKHANLNVINSLFRIIMMLSAVVMIGEAPQLIAGIINIQHDDGTEIIKEVTGAVRQVNYFVSGQALVDKAALLGDEFRSFIPGTALVKSAKDKIIKIKDFAKKKELEQKGLRAGLSYENAKKAAEEMINAKNLRRDARSSRRSAGVSRANANKNTDK